MFILKWALQKIFQVKANIHKLWERIADKFRLGGRNFCASWSISGSYPKYFFLSHLRRAILQSFINYGRFGVIIDKTQLGIRVFVHFIETLKAFEPDRV